MFSFSLQYFSFIIIVNSSSLITLSICALDMFSKLSSYFFLRKQFCCVFLFSHCFKFFFAVLLLKEKTTYYSNRCTNSSNEAIETPSLVSDKTNRSSLTISKRCNILTKSFTHCFSFTNLSNKIVFYFISFIKSKLHRIVLL